MVVILTVIVVFFFFFQFTATKGEKCITVTHYKRLALSIFARRHILCDVLKTWLPNILFILMLCFVIIHYLTDGDSI